MTFTRTASGIANEAIFLGVNFIVYVEEDQNLELSRSVDIAFWSSFFRHNFPDFPVQFKGLGGKRHVLEYARIIIDRSIPNSLCALDRDYDDIFAEDISDERVFYTYGYGTENDIFNESSVPVLSEALLPAHLEVDFGLSIWKSICRTFEIEYASLISDQLSACRGQSSLNRASPAAVLDQNNSALPVKFRRGPIRDSISKYHELPITRKPVKKISPFSHRVPAHLFFEVVYLTLSRSVKNLSIIRCDKDWVRNICLSFFRRNWEEHLGADALLHYKQLSRRDLSKFRSVI